MERRASPTYGYQYIAVLKMQSRTTSSVLTYSQEDVDEYSQYLQTVFEYNWFELDDITQYTSLDTVPI